MGTEKMDYAFNNAPNNERSTSLAIRFAHIITMAHAVNEWMIVAIAAALLSIASILAVAGVWFSCNAWIAAIMVGCVGLCVFAIIRIFRSRQTGIKVLESVDMDDVAPLITRWGEYVTALNKPPVKKHPIEQ